MARTELKYWTAFGFGVVLMFWGFVAPPYGEISQSVLVASGELLILAAAIVGIELNFDFKNLLMGRKSKRAKKANNDGGTK